MWPFNGHEATTRPECDEGCVQARPPETDICCEYVRHRYPFGGSVERRHNGDASLYQGGYTNVPARVHGKRIKQLIAWQSDNQLTAIG
jgi:hypothetical protein